MKKTSRQHSERRMPYIKLVFIMGMITFFKDCQKMDEATQYLKLDIIAGICGTTKTPHKDPGSASCSKQISQIHPITLNQVTYEK